MSVLLILGEVLTATAAVAAIAWRASRVEDAIDVVRTENTQQHADARREREHSENLFLARLAASDVKVSDVQNKVHGIDVAVARMEERQGWLMRQLSPAPQPSTENDPN